MPAGSNRLIGPPFLDRPWPRGVCSVRRPPSSRHATEAGTDHEERQSPSASGAARISLQATPAPLWSKDRIRTGQLVLRTITAWEAPIAVVPPEFDGYHVSQIFPVFSLDPEAIDPCYMQLICQWPSFWEEMRARTRGTVLRRKTLSATDLLSIEVPLPSLEEQRRIIDLMDSADTLIESLRATAESASIAVDCHLDALVSENVIRLGGVVAMGSGPSWKSEQETAVPVDGAISVVSITNTKPNGRLDLSESRYVVDLPSGVRRLSPHSLIMIRTNGNRKRIGNIYRAVPETIGSAVSAFQIALEPLDPADSTYIYWVIRSPRIQAQITAVASGTTGLGNVAVSWLRDLELAWPTRPERDRYISVAEDLDAVNQAAEDQRMAALNLRTALLVDLLSGEHTISDTYDTLLGSS